MAAAPDDTLHQHSIRVHLPTATSRGTLIMLTHSSQQFVRQPQMALTEWQFIIAEYPSHPSNKAPYNQAIVNDITKIIERYDVDLTKALVLMIESNLEHAGSHNPVITLLQALIDQILTPANPHMDYPTQVLLFSGTGFHKENFDEAIATLRENEHYRPYADHFAYRGKEESLIQAIRKLALASSKVSTPDASTPTTSVHPEDVSAPAAATAAVFAPHERHEAPLAPPPSSWYCC